MFIIRAYQVLLKASSTHCCRLCCPYFVKIRWVILRWERETKRRFDTDQDWSNLDRSQVHPGLHLRKCSDLFRLIADREGSAETPLDRCQFAFKRSRPHSHSHSHSHSDCFWLRSISDRSNPLVWTRYRVYFKTLNVFHAF